MNELEGYCIMEDDMQEIYQGILDSEKVIIATPVYMNHITGILKNVIDRFNPFCRDEELLKGKKFYVIAIGQMSVEENIEVAEVIKKYFEGISKFLGFKLVFFRYLSSGDSENIDDIVKNYKDYDNIIEEIKNEIEK